MAYEATVPVHRRLLWSAVTDPERLLGAVPNLVVEASTEQGVAARLRLRVGDRSITFRGIARLVELVPEQLCAVLEIEAVHGRSDGALEGRVEIRLRPSGTGTLIEIRPELELSGHAPTVPPQRLAEAGGRLIPRWFDQLASTEPEPRATPVALSVVPEAPPAQPSAEPHGGPTLTLITGNAEDASPSPKAPLRLVSGEVQDAEFEQPAESDLWSRGRGHLLAPMWVAAAGLLGLAGLSLLVLRRLLRRR